MTRIVLKKHYNEKYEYLGMSVVDTEDLTPEFIKKLKEDKADRLGWRKHRKVMKEHGYDIE